jgi:AraC-like DNA-binding protein
VLALLRDREAVARLTMALRHGVHGATTAGTTLVRVERVTELRTALTERQFALVVVERVDADGVATAETIRAIRAAHPSLVVVGWTTRTDPASAILAFARAGVHELVLESVDDDGGRALRAALAAAVQRSAADRLLDAVAAIFPSSFVPVARYCLEHAHEAACTVPNVAQAFGITRQALVARARRAGVPSPHAIVTWCRLLIAADMLASSARSVDDVAIDLDFPSGNGLRNALRRYAGLSVKDVRQGGVDAVLAALRGAVREAAAAEVAEVVQPAKAAAPLPA